MKKNEKKGEQDVLEERKEKEKNSPGGREEDQVQDLLAFQVNIEVHINKNSSS